MVPLVFQGVEVLAHPTKVEEMIARGYRLKSDEPVNTPTEDDEDGSDQRDSGED